MNFGKTIFPAALQSIFDTIDLQVQRMEVVHGGDINDAYCLHASSATYFLKINDARRYPEMFVREAAGLKTLKVNCNLTVPEVICYGSSGTYQYLVLEWIEKGQPRDDFAFHLGKNLAQMHRRPQVHFGFEADNYIGSLPQINKPSESWSAFYTECRVMPLMKILFDKNAVSANDIKKAEQFCHLLPEIFPSEPPALLHGDLWSGNYSVTADGYAAIYDPAVYFGHREMDIGMTLLFGGFPAGMYEAYNEHYPMEKNWKKRIPFTQLYPLLVHAILFNGHYVSAVKEILSDF